MYENVSFREGFLSSLKPGSPASSTWKVSPGKLPPCNPFERPRLRSRSPSEAVAVLAVGGWLGGRGGERIRLLMEEILHHLKNKKNL